MKEGNTKERRPRVYCFGNPLLKEDRLPLELIPQLQREFPGIEFIEANSPDDIEEPAGKGIVHILDTAKGIKKVTVITDIDSLCPNKACSLHDFDLGMTLKLMKKMGRIKGVKVFCIPMDYGGAEAFAELRILIKDQVR